jgi:hypothetical protein
VETDRRIYWKPQNSFGRGIIEIGQEEVSAEEKMTDSSELVPAGQTVTVGSMDVKFV